MNRRWRMAGFIFAVELMLGIAGMRSARAQESVSAPPGPSGAAERIAALEQKLRVMEARLEFLENKLGESAPPLVASNGVFPTAALRTSEASPVLTAAADPPAPAVQNAGSQAAPAALVNAGPEGFSIQSPQGDFRLGIRYQVQVDGRFAAAWGREYQGKGCIHDASSVPRAGIPSFPIDFSNNTVNSHPAQQSPWSLVSQSCETTTAH